jgi:hypothetical protein
MYVGSFPNTSTYVTNFKNEFFLNFKWVETVEISCHRVLQGQAKYVLYVIVLPLIMHMNMQIHVCQSSSWTPHLLIIILYINDYTLNYFKVILYKMMRFFIK